MSVDLRKPGHHASAPWIAWLTLNAVGWTSASVLLLLELRFVGWKAFIATRTHAVALAVEIPMLGYVVREFWSLYAMRAWLPCERLLPEKIPNAWIGPEQAAKPPGSWEYSVRAAEDAPVTEAVRVFLLRQTGETLFLAVAIYSLEEGVASTDARCRDLLGWFGREAWTEAPIGQDPSARFWISPAPRKRSRRTKLRTAFKMYEPWDDLGFVPFLERPAPVPFPREPFTAALASHTATVRAHLEGIEFAARREPYIARPLDYLADHVCLMRADGEKLSVDILRRNEAAYLFRNLFCIHEALATRSSMDALDTIVVANEVVSLRCLTASNAGKRPHLMMNDTEETFEPLRQERSASGRSILIEWQVRAGSRVRRSRTAIPERATSMAEATDRLFAARAEAIRRTVWTGLPSESLDAKLIWFRESRISGECLMAIDNHSVKMFGFLHAYPRVRQRVFEERTSADWHPVVIMRRGHAGLRWLPLTVNADPQTRPENVDEAFRPVGSVDEDESG